jgi:hypothetical protein
MPGLTRRGDWLGTAEYVSPEQVEGEPATERSDLYALAAVAFEALTGRPPFARREASAVLLAHVREPAPDASGANSGLPVAVDEVLARGLAKSPGDRPADARGLVDELRHALGSDVLRPTVVGGAAPGAPGSPGDPWDAALTHFSRNGGGGRQDPPTEAFGDAGRRRALAMGRDLLVAAGVGLAVLVLGAGLGGWALGRSQADATGAEARGYADGRQAGFGAGRADGLADGKRIGLREGTREGRRAGFAAGRKRGAVEGREEGYASGVSDGRVAALGGLDPGAWYVVRVGEDEVGPVVAGSSPVTPDAGQCYTVSGQTVLSGPC